MAQTRLLDLPRHQLLHGQLQSQVSASGPPDLEETEAGTSKLRPLHHIPRVPTKGVIKAYTCLALEV